MTADTDKGARPKNLGRGLAALFGEESADYAELDKARPAKAVPIEFLRPGKYQPRQRFDQAQIQSLVDSIKEKGILQPILVRRLASEPNAYEIVAGERRWRAAQLAQLHEVPVNIRELSDRDALEIALVENIQRENLNAIEEADGYRRLMAEFNHTQEDLAKAVGKSRSHIANLLRLLSLPDGIRLLVESGELSAGHARALIGLEDAEALAKQAVAEDLSVRQIEELAKAERRKGAGKSEGESAKKKTPPRDANIIALERDLTNLLGLKVGISFDGKGGVLSVHYKTLDQLDDVLRRMGK
ncbi:MAG: ParB/RepB/Spo0J family partition protein [Alphaproteobacteria bacterium]